MIDLVFKHDNWLANDLALQASSQSGHILNITKSMCAAIDLEVLALHMANLHPSAEEWPHLWPLVVARLHQPPLELAEPHASLLACPRLWSPPVPARTKETTDACPPPW
jgi:hypothetical protein